MADTEKKEEAVVEEKKVDVKATTAPDSAEKQKEESTDSSDADAVAKIMGDDVEKAPVPQTKVRGRSARVSSTGVAHIRATFNNTLVSIADINGGIVSWSSAGRSGFKGSKKSTAFAATLAGQDAARQAASKGMREVEVHVQGAGAGRESAIRAIQSSGLNIALIKDVTPMPHNGCRPRKRRRV